MDNIEEKVKLKKEFIKNQVLNEDIKNKIKQAMKEEYEKNDCDKKIAHASKIYKKVIGAVACMLIISSVAFAGSIGDFFTNIFKNTEMNKEQVIDPNSIIEINSEYVTNEGIGLNVAYMYEDDDYLYIAMNVQGIDNVIELVVEEFKINDITSNRNYSFLEVDERDFSNIDIQYKNDSKMIFFKIDKSKDMNLIKELKLNIKNITFETQSEGDVYVRGEWIFKIKKP